MDEIGPWTQQHASAAARATTFRPVTLTTCEAPAAIAGTSAVPVATVLPPASMMVAVRPGFGAEDVPLFSQRTETETVAAELSSATSVRVTTPKSPMCTSGVVTRWTCRKIPLPATPRP